MIVLIKAFELRFASVWDLGSQSRRLPASYSYMMLVMYGNRFDSYYVIR